MVGNGDDAAVLKAKGQVVITTDTLNEGIHFFSSVDPVTLGYRSLIVNLSDLAAMGAKPWCFTLSLCLPESSEDFLAPFAQGLSACAKEYGMSLIGGNTTRGPLSITIEALGLMEDGVSPLLRSGARPEDRIYVTGNLGFSALYVKAGLGELEVSAETLKSWEYLSQRSVVYIAFAHEAAKRGLCSCGIDLSDGILGDLAHILQASKCGAELELTALPLDEHLQYLEQEDDRLELAATGGGDYQLLLGVSKQHEDAFLALADRMEVKVSKVGIITRSAYKVLKHGTISKLKIRGFDHFSALS